MGYIEEIRTLVGHRPLILVVAAVLILDKDGKVLLQERTFLKMFGEFQEDLWNLENHQKKLQNGKSMKKQD